MFYIIQGNIIKYIILNLCESTLDLTANGRVKIQKQVSLGPKILFFILWCPMSMTGIWKHPSILSV